MYINISLFNESKKIKLNLYIKLEGIKLGKTLRVKGLDKK
jgi:hypothetical protein